jgi:FMN phosphatase YigB (HAD superfamily)
MASSRRLIRAVAFDANGVLYHRGPELARDRHFRVACRAADRALQSLGIPQLRAGRLVSSAREPTTPTDLRAMKARAGIGAVDSMAYRRAVVAEMLLRGVSVVEVDEEDETIEEVGGEIGHDHGHHHHHHDHDHSHDHDHGHEQHEHHFHGEDPGYGSDGYGSGAAEREGEVSALEFFRREAANCSSVDLDSILLEPGARDLRKAERQVYLYPGTVDGLQKLADMGIHRAIITNAVDSSAEKRRWLEEAGIPKRLACEDPADCDHLVTMATWDAVVSSADAGSAKPDRAIYDQCANELEVSPDEILFVGHSAVDLAGARDAGMMVSRFRPENDPRSSEKREKDRRNWEAYASKLSIPVEDTVSDLTQLADRLARG